MVLETKPGRIEAVVLAGTPPGADARPAPPTGLAWMRAVKAANATLGPNQRIAGWRLWPEEDFPRTHTLKVKRDLVRAWADVESALPVQAG